MLLTAKVITFFSRGAGRSDKRCTNGGTESLQRRAVAGTQSGPRQFSLGEGIGSGGKGVTPPVATYWPAFRSSPNSDYGSKNMSNCELDRYKFILPSMGEDMAKKHMSEILATYREVTLDPTKMTMYRRQLVEAYLCCKKIVSETHPK